MSKFFHKINLEKMNEEAVLSLLSSEFPNIVKTDFISFSRTYFDTFDARLLNAGISLYQIDKGNAFILENSENSLTKFELNSTPKFLKDFSIEVKTSLSQILGIRSLFPVVKISGVEINFNLQNEDRKTEIRGTFLKLKKENKTQENCYVTLNPLRGYPERLYEAEKVFIENNITGISQKEFQKELFAENININPAYTDKPVFDITSNMTTYQAVIKILTILTDVFVSNEFGIINDYDTEFLHDYRVAIRKARSLLSQLKKVFNNEMIVPHLNNLKKYASATNNLRDMDVYLLSREEYMKMLPEHLHEDLSRFFIDVTKKKKKENRIISKLLRSKEYNEDIEEWKKFLISELPEIKGEESNINVVELSKKYIFKRFSKIIKQGSKVQHESPDEDFHEVRISCKKLRYLLELFASLYPQKEISEAVKQLKTIQDCLGNFNDMCMQQVHLDKYLHSLSGIKSDNTKIAAAIGGLISATYNKKMEFRSEFYNKFAEFECNENRKLYEKLFK